MGVPKYQGRYSIVAPDRLDAFEKKYPGRVKVALLQIACPTIVRRCSMTKSSRLRRLP